MPIPLLHFPYVVQKEIFKSMEYCEMFLMSLCSKRMKNCVIQAKVKIAKIWYGVYPDMKLIGIQDCGIPADMHIAFDDQSEPSGVEPMKMNIGDNFKTLGIVKTKLTRLKQEYCLISVPKLDAKVTKSLHEHVKQLFRYTVPCGIEIHMNSLTEELPIYENVSKILVKGKSILDLNDLDTFMSQYYPNLTTLLICSPINEEATSKLLEIGRVHLSYSGKCGITFLSKFNGKKINLWGAVVTEKMLNEFIRKWMKSDGYQNLEFVNIKLSPECVLNRDHVIDQLEIEEFDEMKRPGWYQSEFRLFMMKTNRFDFSGNDCFDVIRESDGKRASVLSTPSSFTFLVWN
ncbi:hypothetical protein GCK72_000083 [Caenorhabditis remanei]|uniref:F-box domain-containing protein n=1 Tax=Caenorhabditis remanei TaxID=31234 RepID=A0A6A5HM90_CAERE|nr:hypothetical protein GCK72_000083 [Caenorhabditis remanei]KAF1768271.1 hypothetical protein GCK72_000083 [Caenorhabditis remanei]